MLHLLPFRLADFMVTCPDGTKAAVCAGSSNIPNSTDSLPHALAHFTNLGLLLVGGLSVIFVVVGGLQYVLSAGNPQKTKQARETILYAVIGIVIASAAYAIVTFLAGRI